MYKTLHILQYSILFPSFLQLTEFLCYGIINLSKGAYDRFTVKAPLLYLFRKEMKCYDYAGRQCEGDQ